jgi:hypothetical protein
VILVWCKSVFDPPPHEALVLPFWGDRRAGPCNCTQAMRFGEDVHYIYACICYDLWEALHTLVGCVGFTRIALFGKFLTVL